HLTAQHVRAALAAPFIYPPVQVDGELFYEGADRDPIPQKQFFDIPHIERVDTFVIIDILASLEYSLVRPPRDLWDAYVLSIVTPIVSLAVKETKSFVAEVNSRFKKKTHHVKFEIPSHHAPYLLDWSRSNMSALWEIGYARGQAFINDYGD